MFDVVAGVVVYHYDVATVVDVTMCFRCGIVAIVSYGVWNEYQEHKRSCY